MNFRKTLLKAYILIAIFSASGTVLAQNWDFWIHGVNVQIEKSFGNDKVGDPIQEIRRYSGGTVVRQDGGTSNWFHFAIPTPTVLDSDQLVKLKEVYVKANIGENVRVTHLHVWDGDEKILSKDNLSISGQTIDPGNFVHQLPKQKVYWGLVVSLGVTFIKGQLSTQEIRLVGAGVRFIQ